MTPCAKFAENQRKTVAIWKSLTTHSDRQTHQSPIQ